MNKLLDDENEEDEAFWNQDALKEVFDHSFFCFLIVLFFFLHYQLFAVQKFNFYHFL